MLSKHDAAVVARDRELRGLGLLLDADGFAAWLDAAAPDHAVRDVAPLYLRYKPGSSCVAGFRVTTGNGAAVELYAKAHTDAHYATVAARREPARFTTLAHPRLLSDRHRFVVRHAAGDRELLALRRLADAKYRAGLLGKLLAQDLDTADLATIRYKAERRFVGRVSRDHVPVALVKAYTRADFPGAFTRARLADAAGLARLLGSADGRRAIALEWRNGATPDTLEAAAFDMAARGAGAALASLHGTSIALPFRRDRGEEIKVALDAAAAISALSPALGRQATTTIRQAAEAFEAVASTSATIHGDFSIDQLLVTNGVVTILDWDRLCLGDAGADLGSFAARLEADAVAGLRPATAAQSALSALLDGYEDACRAIPDTVALHTVLGLVRLAPEPFRCRLPDWPERTAALISRAGAILDRSAPTRHRNRRAG